MFTRPADLSDDEVAAVEDDPTSLFRLRWALTDLALYATDFHRPHQRDDDTVNAWAAFTATLGSLHHLLPTIRRPWASR